MQSYIVKCISLCCAVVVSVCAHAQSVEELCKEHVDHLGGKMAVEKVKTIKIQQVTPSKISPTSVYAYYEPGKVYFQKRRSRELTLTTCATLKDAWNHSSYPVKRKVSPRRLKSRCCCSRNSMVHCMIILSMGIVRTWLQLVLESLSTWMVCHVML